MAIPVNFEKMLKRPPAANAAGYPFSIKAEDLDENFIYAALEADGTWIDAVPNGKHIGRRLKLPPIPSGDGFFVLTSNGGEIGWSQCEVEEFKVCVNGYPETRKFLTVV